MHIYFQNFKSNVALYQLPRWLSKESAYNVGDLGSIPGSGRSPGEGNGYPLQSAPGNETVFTLMCFQSLYMYRCPLFVPALPLNMYFTYMFHVYYK